jgi:hypothetical protein
MLTNSNLYFFNKPINNFVIDLYNSPYETNICKREEKKQMKANNDISNIFSCELQQKEEIYINLSNKRKGLNFYGIPTIKNIEIEKLCLNSNKEYLNLKLFYLN